METMDIFRADHPNQEDPRTYDEVVQDYFIQGWKPRQPIIVDNIDVGIEIFNPFT